MNKNTGSDSDKDFQNKDNTDFKNEWGESDSPGFGDNHSKEKSKERPLGIKILSIVFIINGIISLLVVASGLTGDLDFFHQLIIGVAAFPIAYGLWKGLSWARIGAIIIVLLAIAVPIINVIILKGEGGSSISLIVNILLLFYLFKGDVKDYFK